LILIRPKILGTRHATPQVIAGLQAALLQRLN
jgi:hypothetical protein